MTPEKFGRYEVQAEIGDGAMGRVYRGFDPLARRLVAIKTIKSELLSKESGAEYVHRFQREAQAAGRLSHPHIVTIYDVGENYFVMELLEGETLHAVLKRRGRLELHEALGVISPVADAIDYAHRNGVIHRDIKPANIMVLQDGRPKLMDFGVVHVDSTAMTAAGQFLGSPLYMAPEQIASGEVTGKTDIFALAAVAYEMVTGRRAFEGQSVTSIIYRVMNDTPSPPRTWNVELPPHYDDVFAKALSKDPSLRHRTAAEFAAALDLKNFDESLLRVLSPELPAPPVPADALETHDLPAAAISAAVPTPPPQSKPPAAVPVPLIAAGVLLLAGLGIWWARAHRVPEPIPPPPAKSAPAVAIESSPANATVFLDDREVGVTPLQLPNLPFGDHVVRVTRSGYASGQLSIAITPEGLPPLHFVLEPLTAPLHLISLPEGSTARLDGRDLGTTPLDGVFVSPGRHEMIVEHPGFRIWRSSFDAVAGTPVEMSVTLDRAIEKLEHKHPAPTPRPVPTVEPKVREGDMVELDASVIPPRKVAGKTAVYPPQALERRIQGKVTVELTVTETGDPIDVHVIESAGEILDKPVMDAIRTYHYEPATKQGVKVRVRIRESQQFEVRSAH